jgi:flavin reductase (DIM6/NTAB) family NADH-FMN oxidoreductase RutF
MEHQLFKNCMSRIPTSVSLVSVVDQGFLMACTISSLTSVSVDSSAVLFVLKSQSRTLIALEKSQYFSINLLSDEQENLSIEYSGKREEQRLERLGNLWDFSKERFPILRKSAMSLACELLNTQIIGSSTVVTAKLLSELDTSEAGPLIYLNRSYHVASPVL